MPSTTRQPAAAASRNRRGRRGVYTASKTVSPGRRSPGGGRSRAPATEQHHALPGRVGVGLAQGVECPQTIGVGAQEPAVLVHDGVDAADGARGGVDLVDAGERGHLVRDGDRESAVTERARCLDGLRDVARLDVVRHVDEGQAKRLEGGVVKGRGERVTYGVTEERADPEAGIDPGHSYSRRPKPTTPPLASANDLAGDLGAPGSATAEEAQ